MEYLFLVQSGFDDVVRIIEHGPSLCGDERAALPLTDSLHCAEMKVLKSKPIEGRFLSQSFKSIRGVLLRACFCL